jgi:peroxiredoxin
MSLGSKKRVHCVPHCHELTLKNLSWVQNEHVDLCVKSLMIAVGDKFPSVQVVVSDNSLEEGTCARPKRVNTDELFKGLVILFAVPGAFTPTCHLQHLPGFLKHADDFFQKNVNGIFCISTNDIYVMDAWGKHMRVGTAIGMVADGNGELVRKLGLDLDLSDKLMGACRTQRFALILKDGVVQYVGVGGLEHTGAEAVLAKI